MKSIQKPEKKKSLLEAVAALRGFDLTFERIRALYSAETEKTSG